MPRAVEHRAVEQHQGEENGQKEGAERHRLWHVGRDEAEKIVDPGRIDQDTGRHAEKLLHLEGFERLDEGGDERRQQRWRQKRDRDAAQGHPSSRARHGRRLFVRRIHQALRRLDQDHHDRNRAERQVQPGDAGQRVNVHHWYAGEVSRILVDDAVIRVEQENPAERRRQDRQEEGKPKHVHDDAFAEDVVAREIPRNDKCDRESGGNAQAEQERGPDRAKRLRAVERALPRCGRDMQVVERVASLKLPMTITAGGRIQ